MMWVKKPSRRLAHGALSVLALALLPLVAGAMPAGVKPEVVATATTPVTERFGVLVMAHGGGDAWNREVEAALAPLRKEFPVQVAFGMADATTMQQGADALKAQGVGKIGVVRLFISGESWYERTQQIFGVLPGAPARPAPDPHAAHAGHGEHAGHSMAFWKVDSDARFAISHDGLADATQMGAVLADRARTLSQNPAQEDVLILAHGPGDDAENARWIEKINARAEVVRASQPFRRVQVMTLREDWPEKRVAAEEQIRSYVQRAAAEQGRAIVIPFRVQGFGPYTKVLEGLSYTSDGVGLVPSIQVTDWVRQQAERLRDGPFVTPVK